MDLKIVCYSSFCNEIHKKGIRRNVFCNKWCPFAHSLLFCFFFFFFLHIFVLPYLVAAWFCPTLTRYKCNFEIYYGHYTEHIMQHTLNGRGQVGRTVSLMHTEASQLVLCVCACDCTMKYKSIILKNPHHQHTINLSRDYYLFIIANCKL